MKLDIDESLWAEYEGKLREAYRIYYDTLQKHGLAWFLAKNPSTTEDVKRKLEDLIKALPHPDQASLAEMVIIGWWGTCWYYEYFYWCGKDGQTPKEFTQTALHDLSMLTYHNKEPKMRPLIETIVASAKLADNIARATVLYWRCKSI
jgi:hypothetical protein